MPELPEVETVRRGLQPVLEGATISGVTLGRAGLRYPFPERFAERLAGRRVLGIGRRSKYLLWEVEGGETLLAHLGMSGSFRIEHPSTAGMAESSPGAFALALLAGKLDYLRELEHIWRDVQLHGDCLSLKDLAVSGKDLIADGMTPGPDIGRVLEHLLELVL